MNIAKLKIDLLGLNEGGLFDLSIMPLYWINFPSFKKLYFRGFSIQHGI